MVRAVRLLAGVLKFIDGIGRFLPDPGRVFGSSRFPHACSNLVHFLHNRPELRLYRQKSLMRLRNGTQGPSRGEPWRC